MAATLIKEDRSTASGPDVVAEQAVSREVERSPRTLRFYGDEFVFDTVSGMFFVVSATASFILRALDAGTPTDQLADKLQRRYGISRETAVRDIQGLLDRIAVIEPLKLVRV